MFDLQIDDRAGTNVRINKHCGFYCSKSKTIHGGTPVQIIVYISITKGLCTLITHLGIHLHLNSLLL
jgi:hypothetical protein